MGNIDRQLGELACAQFGAVSAGQRRALGIRSVLFQRRVDRGVWRMATDSVAVSTSAPDCYEQRVTIGLLEGGPGTAMSSVSAVAFYGVPGFEREPIHLSRTRVRRKLDARYLWHHPRFLPPHHVLEVNGLIMTTPARALADVAGLNFHPKRLERAFDTAWSARLVNRELLTQMADEWCERGRKGSAFLKAYLDSRPVDFVPAASNVARRFVQLVVDAGMPEPRSETNVGNAVAWLGRVDCLDPELPLVAEIDSDRFHAAPLDAAHDEQRDRNMSDAGFAVVRFTEFEVWHRGDDVVHRWRDARRLMRSARQSPYPA